MVSFQTPFPQLDDQRKTLSETNDERNSKNMKRKWNDSHVDEVILPFKHWRNPKPNIATATTTTNKSFSDVELHLETPLPSEWQRCLDIKSGEIHFYNTRTQKRTLRDPRESSSDPPIPRECHMSLDLELNLPCGSLNLNSPKSTSQKNSPTRNKKSSNSLPPPPPPMRASMDLFRSLSTVGIKNDTTVEEADESTEMVATACKRCHMLVMLCKSSPTCPNCKYVHPPCQSTLDLFKPRLSLSY